MKKEQYFWITLVIILVGTLYILEYCYQNSIVMRSNKAQESTVGAAKTIDSLQRVVDSLYNENYPCQIELGRYEVALDMLRERNPKAAEQFESILSRETE